MSALFDWIRSVVGQTPPVKDAKIVYQPSPAASRVFPGNSRKEAAAGAFSVKFSFTRGRRTAIMGKLRMRNRPNDGKARVYMLQFEELRQRLEGLYPQIQDLAGAIGLPQMKREAEELDMKAAADGFWDDMETAQKVTQRAA